MKLATLRDGTRDGMLVVVKRDGSMYTPVATVAPTLQAALDDWDRVSPRLAVIAEKLERGDLTGIFVDPTRLAAPLPRAYEWVDGSAFLNHVILVRKARKAEPPATLKTDPLVYQGGSSEMLGPRDDVALPDESWGLDFEGEVAVILGDTPRGTRDEAAGKVIRLVTLANDLTLRNLIPDELAKGFGFFQAKPATAFAPFVVTPDELGPAWKEGRLHRRLRVVHNGTLVGDCDAGAEMHFSFHDLIGHITRTRSFTAGTVLGSGTVSNEDRARGISCLAERRTIEIIETGAAKTPFMKVGDTVEIDMLDDHGRTIFGKIQQRVVEARS
jgi:fumarylacetoacetate (FAA) hydrolase